MTEVTSTSGVVRPTSPEMDAILGQEFKVLDHGFIRVVDYMGNDSSVVQAARVSYGEGTKKINEDRGLIRYLLSHHHTSPFEMCEIKLHVKLPIFVARQWIRHRTGSFNEVSGRYSEMSNEFYIPKLENMNVQSQDNKQARGIPQDFANALSNDALMRVSADRANSVYKLLLDSGLAREISRIVLPVNNYTEWYWKTNLHNLMRFLHLRDDPHAQWEIQEYAKTISGLVSKWVPLTHEAYFDYIHNSFSLSLPEQEIFRFAIKDYLNTENKPDYAHKLTKKEWKSFVEKVRILT